MPYKEHLRARWQRVDEAAIEEIILPPIRLYEIGGAYFVRDGNHRVSVALTQGMENIDAEVTALSSEVNIEPGMTVTQLKETLIRYEKRIFYEKTNFLALTGDDNLDFTEPGRYDVVYNHILVHKYYLNESQTEELTFDAALLSWYKNVYRPIISIIQDEWLGMNFPGNSPGDLYVWIVTHWDALKEKNGINFPLSAAARDFATTYGKKRGWFFRFLITHIKGLFHPK
ncbi:hypothetical protein FACS1894200_10390 [Spirochaetia bacterium]|nr:hypothetical protein FACS1894200_10390 [Spirochaetia bacterium]